MVVNILRTIHLLCTSLHIPVAFRCMGTSAANLKTVFESSPDIPKAPTCNTESSKLRQIMTELPLTQLVGLIRQSCQQHTHIAKQLQYPASVSDSPPATGDIDSRLLCTGLTNCLCGQGAYSPAFVERPKTSGARAV